MELCLRTPLQVILNQGNTVTGSSSQNSQQAKEDAVFDSFKQTLLGQKQQLQFFDEILQTGSMDLGVVDFFEQNYANLAGADKQCYE